MRRARPLTSTAAIQLAQGRGPKRQALLPTIEETVARLTREILLENQEAHDAAGRAYVGVDPEAVRAEALRRVLTLPWRSGL